MVAAERFTDVHAHHGEGPVWDANAGLLRWVDMLSGDVLALRPGESSPDADEPAVTRWHVGTVAACLRPRAGGGLVVAVERGFVLTDPHTGEVRPLGQLWRDPSVRMNDGGCDSRGRFYCGSMAYDAAPGRGALYRLDPDGTVHTALSGVTISNGLAFDADGGTAYYVDSPTQRVDAFDYDPDTATFSGRRTVVAVPPEHGMPDGLALDAEGGLWVALWGGGAVHRYTPAGVLDAVVELPVRQVTACAFGGDALDELFITTSRQDVPAGHDPEAGALFHLRPGVPGAEVAAFAG